MPRPVVVLLVLASLLLVGCQTTDPSLLFVQVADGGRLLEDTDGDGWSDLVLDDVSSEVVYFTDRPDRIAGTSSLDDFLDGWDEGTDSFEKDPPNAAMAQIGSSSIEIIEISRPVRSGNSLTYRTRVLQTSTAFADVEAMRGSTPEHHGRVVLFIDNLTMSSGWRGRTRSNPMNRRDNFGR